MTSKPYQRPPWAARVIGGRMAKLFRPSIVCTLAVPGRASGAWHSTPIAVLEHGGQRYLVAAFGDTEWSRNLRAAGTGRLTRRRRTVEFTAVEVPVEQRQPLLDAYLNEFGKFPNVGRTFRTMPDPADHPTFEITMNG